MNDSVFMSVMQTTRGLSDAVDGVRDAQRPVVSHLIGEVGAANVLHRQEVRVRGFVSVEKRDDVRVRQSRRSSHLTTESFSLLLGIHQSVRQHLERHHAVHGPVPCLVDDAHAARPQHVEDDVPIHDQRSITLREQNRCLPCGELSQLNQFRRQRAGLFRSLFREASTKLDQLISTQQARVRYRRNKLVGRDTGIGQWQTWGSGRTGRPRQADRGRRCAGLHPFRRAEQPESTTDFGQQIRTAAAEFFGGQRLASFDTGFPTVQDCVNPCVVVAAHRGPRSSRLTTWIPLSNPARRSPAPSPAESSLPACVS